MTRTTRRRHADTPQRSGPRRVVIVTRLSKDNGDSAVNHGTQEAGCRRKADALGLPVVAVLRDDISGDRLDRPGLDRAIAMIRTGDADTLMTYSTDRLARDQVRLALIISDVRRFGGDVLSATEDLAAGPMGDFMRNVYGFAAEMELVKIRERTNRGFDARFAEAKKYKPGPKPPYGYQKQGRGGDATYTIQPVEADVVSRIWHAAATGQGRRSIATALNADGILSPTGVAWAHEMVRKILGRDVYWTGEHAAWRTRTERDADNVPYSVPRPADEQYRVGGFPILVDRATAQRVRAAAGRNHWCTRRADRTPEVGILRWGYAVCGGCGRAMAVKTSADGVPSYRCTRSERSRPCPAAPSITVETLDGAVWEWVSAMLAAPSLAGAYHWRPATTEPDANALAALADAERAVRDLTVKVEALLDNLEQVTGAAARLAGDRLNAVNAELETATATRDQLAAATRRDTSDLFSVQFREPSTVMAAAAQAATMAMWATDTRPDPGSDVASWIRFPDGEIRESPAVTLTAADVQPPETFAAKQAALAMLNAAVTVRQVGADGPRWTAELRLEDGTSVNGADGRGGAYMPTTSRCCCRGAP